MGKFGKKINVSTDLSRFMVAVMAPSGFGKSTLMYQVCEKEFGPDGYIICDMGTEDGLSALQGVTAESVPTWKKFKEVVDDIVKNKTTDYEDLKVIVLDTLDETFNIAEEFTVASWNRENMGKQGFTPSTSINSVEGGFGKGMDRVIDTVKKEIIRLDKVGVKVWWTSHVKEKDQSDLFTGASYTSLTANMPMKYFSSIKNSSHIVAFGYFDRSIEKQEVGDANPMTKKKKERKAVLDEVRKIKFRDDALVADAKSRFSSIVDEIVLDPDLFIKAIKDAIEAEKNNKPITSAVTIKQPTKPIDPIIEDEPIEEPVVEEDITEDIDTALDTTDDIFEEEVNVVELVSTIRSAFKASTDAEAKKAVKAILASNGGKLSEDMPIGSIKEIANILGI